MGEKADSNLVFIGGKSWEEHWENLDYGPEQSDGSDSIGGGISERLKLTEMIENMNLFLFTIT